MVYDQQYLSIPGGSGNRIDKRGKSIRIKIEMQNSEFVEAAIFSAKIRLHNIQINVMSFPYHKQPIMIFFARANFQVPDNPVFVEKVL